MSLCNLLAVLVSLAILTACERGPAVERSMLQTARAKRLTTPTVAGVAHDAIFIPKPHGYAGESEGKVWRIDADDRYATQVRVEYGSIAGDLIQVRAGLNAGDHVILSDMSAWSGIQRVRLQR